VLWFLRSKDKRLWQIKKIQYKKSVENTCRKGWEIKTPSNNERKWKLVGTASQQHEKSNKIQ